MTVAQPDPPRTIGIDVGGTKTHLALGAGNILRSERYVDTTSWRTHSFPHNARGVHRLVVEWLGSDALAWPMAVGAHGCDTTAQCDAFAAELRRYFTGPLRVVNDAELVTAATGLTEGIGVIAGTGAIAVARDARGELLTAGGWGWILGDEGSSAGLIREATRAVLTELDLGGALDPLGRRLMAAFGVTEGAELALAVSTADSAASLGSHAEQVFLAADEGSALAAGVVTQAGQQLALLVDRLAGRGAAAAQIVAGGTVILVQPRLRRAFLDAVREHQPSSVLQFLDRPPVLGALELASRLGRDGTEAAEPAGTGGIR
ncbi:sugar kinase [Rugosimonospora africana]|uniref:Sugar kinase n=2 Tax=Rugosimonospora africana TaxID=556532 RepID=A0A8J3VR92_9ACTN|nr:sugar kinase [Rugosimonospora africana]